MSAYRLALLLRTTTQRVYDIINKRRRITPEMSLRLAKCFGTTAHFWLNTQLEYELEQANEQWGAKIENEVTSFETAMLQNTRAPGEKVISESGLQEILDKHDEKERRVYGVIANSEDRICFDLMMEKMNMQAGELSAALIMLELGGLIHRVPGDAYVKAHKSIYKSSPISSTL
jgi:antitoxin HigA-1